MLTVYSKESCSQCVMLKNLLNVKNIPADIKMLDVDYTQEELLAKAPIRSYPAVFKDDEFIGGLNEVKMLIAKGIL